MVLVFPWKCTDVDLLSRKETEECLFPWKQVKASIEADGSFRGSRSKHTPICFRGGFHLLPRTSAKLHGNVRGSTTSMEVSSFH